MRLDVFEKDLPPVLLARDDLPSLPAVALEVLRIAQDEDATLDELATCLSRDPALAARLLRLANSTLFGGAKNVTTLQRAVVVLGMKTVKLMALSFSLAGSLPRSGRKGSFDFAVYWRRSLVCAIAARSLARLAGVPHGDEAFLCGLFAHFGKLVLTRAMPEEYEPVLVRAHGWPAPELEEEHLGFRSADVCAALLRSWDLPALLYVTVGYGTRPAELDPLATREQRRLVELLGLAHLAEAVLCDEDRGTPLARLHAEMRRQHGISEGEVDALLVGLETGIHETAELLSVQLQAGASHEEIVARAHAQMAAVSLDTAVDLVVAQRRNEELEREKRVLESRATTDGLTGLANRAAFDVFLAREVRSRVGGQPSRGLGLLMLDIDHFKRFNDAHGHLVGDEVLRMVGRLLEALTRKGDLAARYGGEEFAVVVPQTTPGALAAIGARRRDAIAAEMLVSGGQRLSVTISVGGACVTHFATTKDGEALIRLADQLLYRAKREGRNRCVLHAETELPA
jgi:diguanylate cyclase (GGDEF)-like protein